MLACVAACAPALVNAQRNQAREPPVIYDNVAERPVLGAIEIGRDTVWFGAESATTQVAQYAYSVADRQWARTSGNGHVVSATPRVALGAFPDSVPLGNGWSIVAIERDGVQTHALRDDRGRLLSLRGPRITAQRSYLDRHHTRTAAPWGPVDVQRFLVDDNAIWLGLRVDGDADPEQQLGGVMQVDLATKRATTLANDALMQRTVDEMAIAGGALWVVAPDSADSGRVLRYDLSAHTWSARSLAVPGRVYQMAGAGDVLYLSGAKGIGRYDIAAGSADVRYFHLSIAQGGPVGDTIVYDLGRRPPKHDWNGLALYAVVHAFGIVRAGEFFSAARGLVTAIGVRYYDADVRAEEEWTIGEESSGGLSEDEMEANLTGLRVAGLAMPELAPFYAAAIYRANPQARAQLARILAEIGDPRWVPTLRLVLDAAPRDVIEELYAADVAVALDRLGAREGAAWLVARLSRHVAAHERFHPAAFDRFAEVSDSTLTRELIDVAVSGDTLLAGGAIDALVGMNDPAVVGQLATGLQGATPRTRAWLVSALMNGVFKNVWSPAVADSTRYAADGLRNLIVTAVRPAVHDTAAWTADAATFLVGTFGSAGDVPLLCPLMTDSRVERHDRAILAMISLTGDGAQWPSAREASEESRQASRRWCEQWPERHTTAFEPPPRAVRDSLYEIWDRKRRS